MTGFVLISIGAVLLLGALAINLYGEVRVHYLGDDGSLVPFRGRLVALRLIETVMTITGIILVVLGALQ